MIPEIPDVGLSPRQKILLFRALRRSMSEVERIMQRFMAQELARMDDAACDRFMALLAFPDADLLDWLGGIKTPPAVVDRAILERLQHFKRPAQGEKDPPAT